MIVITAIAYTKGWSYLSNYSIKVSKWGLKVGIRVFQFTLSLNSLLNLMKRGIGFKQYTLSLNSLLNVM